MNLIHPGQLIKLSEGDVVTYTVKSGDNLTKIAKQFGTTVSELADKNDIKDVNKIYVGQVIKI